MKVITIRQPWASLIANGAKKIETRGWATKHRGPIAIHAGLTPVDTRISLELMDRGYNIMQCMCLAAKKAHSFGAIVAVANLVACEKITQSLIDFTPEKERDLGFYEPGRYMWMLEDVRAIDPIPAKGKQGLWNFEHPGLEVP